MIKIMDSNINHNIANKDNVVLISYAAGNSTYLINQEVLNLSARYFGIKTLLKYAPKDIDKKFYHENDHILKQQRGAGYWLWKPYLILETMKQSKEGDIIIYIDGDCLIINDISYLISLTEQHNRLLFENSHINKPYVKRDSYILMNSDNEQTHNSKQLEASYVFLKNNPENREFVAKWLRYSQDERILTDIPSSLGEEFPEFIDHRHEQAILTLLASKYNDQKILSFEDRQKYITNLCLKSTFKSLVTCFIVYFNNFLHRFY